MITRIVKMDFLEEKTGEFIDFFNQNKHKILEFDGCDDVILFRDALIENVFFTISKWRDLDALERYRASVFFKNTWARTKASFADKAQAWSLQDVNLAEDRTL